MNGKMNQKDDTVRVERMASDEGYSASTASKVRAAIVGGAGYTGGEVLRILLHHPLVDGVHVQSTSQAGRFLHEIHRDLLGLTTETFHKDVSGEFDVVFLCTGHGRSRQILDELSLSGATRIIDLSNDFRLAGSNIHEASGRRFVYGLPELQREVISEASNIANPGCFATAIQLALLPLAENGLLKDDIHIHAVTGSTGAGQEPSSTTHHAWRTGNQSVYKPFTHQHLSEIREQLAFASGRREGDTHASLPHITFVPQRGAFTRGIHATITTRVSGLPEKWEQNHLQEMYRTFYSGHPFTQFTSEETDLKSVVNTNFCHLSVRVHDERVLVTSVLDNLIKGAAGQAVQNMNLMFGFPELSGLRLKASVY